MTFLELQNAVLTQLGLSSSDARARVKTFLNQRYREVQSSTNLARTRRGSVNFVTAAGSSTSTATGIAKLFTLYDPTTLDRVLSEVTLAQMREKDPTTTTTGYPYEYAITSHVADAMTVRLWPQPTAIATLVADCLLAATELSGDTDDPAIPTDFHDILVRGAKADELMRMEKARHLADKEEQKFAERLSELRYFLAKSSYLTTVPVDRAGIASGGQVWPYGGRMVT